MSHYIHRQLDCLRLLFGLAMISGRPEAWGQSSNHQLCQSAELWELHAPTHSLALNPKYAAVQCYLVWVDSSRSAPCSLLCSASMTRTKVQFLPWVRLLCVCMLCWLNSVTWSERSLSSVLVTNLKSRPIPGWWQGSVGTQGLGGLVLVDSG